MEHFFPVRKSCFNVNVTEQKMAHTRLFDWLVRHSKLTFILMSFAFIAFGFLSLNLVRYVTANANYLLTYKWTGLVDGGAQQLIEIGITTFFALGFYLLFKLCEHALIERIAHQPLHGSKPASADEI